MNVAESAPQLGTRKAELIQSTRRPAHVAENAGVLSRRTSSLRNVMVITVSSVLFWAGYKIATGHYYTPRSNFGFYLGVVGSLMMLALLTYPLRKHVHFMHRWGALKYWFRWHMILGIVGPLFILFHSTFHLRSVNATIALVSMLVVVLSGVIGRFVYTKIHYGLYGSRASLERVQQEFAAQSDDLKSRLHMAPRVEEWLASFAREAKQVEMSSALLWWHLPALGWRRRVCALRCARELRAIMREGRYPDFRGGATEAIDLARRFLRQAERVVAFTTYERLFSLWHHLHIPLIYLLAASTLIHIIAVYMY